MPVTSTAAAPAASVSSSAFYCIIDMLYNIINTNDNNNTNNTYNINIII